MEREIKESPIRQPKSAWEKQDTDTRKQPLLSAMGNQAALTIQRKVGMEFQTLGKPWNIKKLDNASNQEEAEEDLSDFGFSSHLISPKREFCSMSSDTPDVWATSDNEDLEYITSAFDERTQRVQLVAAAAQAGEAHEAILQKNLSSTLLCDKFYRVRKGGSYYYLNTEGCPTAHPQATVGVRSENISDLINALANQDGTGYLGDPPEITREKRNWKKRVNTLNKANTVRDGPSPKVNGLLALLEEHIAGAAANHPSKPEKFTPVIIDTRLLAEDYNTRLDQLKLQNAPGKDAPDTLGQLMDYANYLGGPIIEFWVKLGGEDGEFMTDVVNPIKDLRTGWKTCYVSLNTFWGQISQSSDKPEAPSPPYTDFAPSDSISQILTYLEDLKKYVTSISGDLTVPQTIIDQFTTIKEEMARLQAEESRYHDTYNTRMERAKKDGLPTDPDHPDNLGGIILSYLKDLLIKVYDIPSLEDFKGRIVEIADRTETLFPPPDMLKSALPVKERTSLKDLYCLLSTEERHAVLDYLRNYPEETLIGYQKHNYLSLGSWIRSLPPDESDGKDRVDLLKMQYLSVGELDNGAPDPDSKGNRGADYFGIYGISRSTDIGYDEEADSAHGKEKREVDGAILELRNLKHNIPTDQWGAAAGAVADLVRAVNESHEEPPEETS